MVRPDLFLTYWAGVGHMATWTGYWKADTSLLALFIAFGSIYMNTFINRQEILWWAEVLLHYLPLVPLFFRSDVRWELAPAIYISTAYLIYRKFDFAAIGETYAYPGFAWDGVGVDSEICCE